jgi:two-component system response regulator FixJ
MMAEFSASVIHVVDLDHRVRAQIARMVADNGGHAEIYEDVEELISSRPSEGVIVANSGKAGAQDLISRLHAADVWLPLVLFCENPAPSMIVRAVHSGVVDYLAWPFTELELIAAHQFCQSFMDRKEAALARKQRARFLIDQLTKREKEVLQLLIEGHSNKSMANVFGLSPRTIEDYRFSLIQKLQVSSTSGAIRIGLEADLDDARMPLPDRLQPGICASL